MSCSSPAQLSSRERGVALESRCARIVDPRPLFDREGEILLARRRPRRQLGACTRGRRVPLVAVGRLDRPARLEELAAGEDLSRRGESTLRLQVLRRRSSCFPSKLSAADARVLRDLDDETAPAAPSRATRSPRFGRRARGSRAPAPRAKPVARSRVARLARPSVRRIELARRSSWLPRDLDRRDRRAASGLGSGGAASHAGGARPKRPPRAGRAPRHAGRSTDRPATSARKPLAAFIPSPVPAPARRATPGAPPPPTFSSKTSSSPRLVIRTSPPGVELPAQDQVGQRILDQPLDRAPQRPRPQRRDRTPSRAASASAPGVIVSVMSCSFSRSRT